MSRYVSTIESVFREQVGPAAQLATKHVREGATSAAEIVENTDYKAHALNAAQYTMDHPYWIAGMAASLVPVIAPAAVGGSVLGIAGFSATGPVSGSVAAGAQAAANPVVAHGVIATLQSAAMGGYGASPVFGAIRGIGIAAHAAGYAARFLPWGKQEAAVGETSLGEPEEAPEGTAASQSNADGDPTSANEEDGDDEKPSRAHDRRPDQSKKARL